MSSKRWYDQINNISDVKLKETAEDKCSKTKLFKNRRNSY